MKKSPEILSVYPGSQKKGSDGGSILEITVTPPDGEPISTNLKVQSSDLELLQKLTEVLSQNP
ncbi:MAG: hypothetical protein ACLR6B_09685 [Blautia sp.]